MPDAADHLEPGLLDQLGKGMRGKIGQVAQLERVVRIQIGDFQEQVPIRLDVRLAQAH
jgi:hypothetical protein